MRHQALESFRLASVFLCPGHKTQQLGSVHSAKTYWPKYKRKNMISWVIWFSDHKVWLSWGAERWNVIRRNKNQVGEMWNADFETQRNFLAHHYKVRSKLVDSNQTGDIFCQNPIIQLSNRVFTMTADFASRPLEKVLPVTHLCILGNIWL